MAAVATALHALPLYLRDLCAREREHDRAWESTREHERGGRLGCAGRIQTGSSGTGVDKAMEVGCGGYRRDRMLTSFVRDLRRTELRGVSAGADEYD